MLFRKSTLLLSLITLCAARTVHADGGDGSDGAPASTAAPDAASTAVVSKTSDDSSSATTSSAASVQTVHVGGKGPTRGMLMFTPEVITADPGAQIEFRFDDAAHSVAQGAFDKPCQPIGTNAFYSGLITAGGDKTKTFTITVNDTNTIWFYCAESLHCVDGMVGVINPPKNKGQTLDQYKDAANKLGPEGVKGTTAPTNVQGGKLGSSVDTDPEPSVTTGAPPAATSSGAAVARGVAVGGMALVGLVGGLLL